jgi:hypothetical protein
MRRIMLAACAAVVPSLASAHHPDVAGGGGSGAIVTIGASTLEAGQAAVAFIEQYIKISGFDFNSLGANQHAHTMDYISSPAVAAAYGVTDDFTISARLPYVRRADIIDGHKHDNAARPPHVTNLGDSEGIGDVSLLGQYRFYNNIVSGTQVAALFGVKLPTGATNRITSEGDLFEAEFQPGSGSLDGLAGLAFSQRVTTALSFHASGLYIRAGDGTQDTNLGDRFIYGLAATYRLIGAVAGPEGAYAHAGEDHPPGTPAHSHARGTPAHSHAPGTPPHSHAPAAPSFALDAVLEVNGEWQDFQRVAGVRDPNSGGNVVYLSPGLRASAGNVGGFLSVGIPVVKDLYGLQAPPDWRVIAGLSYVFGH